MLSDIMNKSAIYNLISPDSCKLRLHANYNRQVQFEKYAHPHFCTNFLKTVNYEGSSLELQTAIYNYREYQACTSLASKSAKPNCEAYLIPVISSGRVSESHTLALEKEREKKRKGKRCEWYIVLLFQNTSSC